MAQAVSYGEPSLKVGRSLVTRWRVADDSIVLLDVDRFERRWRNVAPRKLIAERRPRRTHPRPEGEE